jgi:hypothetical protein
MMFERHREWLRLTAILCVAAVLPGDVVLRAQEQKQQPPAPAEERPPITADQLDSLVAPIALYPDPLLAQVLVASTYPLEIVQLQQWLAKHKELKDKALVEAVKREGWDPSVQAMAALPDVVKRLAESIKWTSELGNAFLAQQSEVMDAVQRMRTRAQGDGKLKSTEQMKVETKVVESKSVIVIEQANPKVVYVPSYDPVVVWGAAPVYAYPPVYYPPAGYYAAGMAISFGVGMAMGAAWGGGWGYNAGWGGNNNININRNNNYVNHYNRTNANNKMGNSWQHNPQHRGGAPYGDRATANKFGGSARGDSLGTRQASARQNVGQGGGRQQSGVSNRAAGGAGGLGGDRAGGGAGGLGANRSGGGGGDRIGSRDVSRGGGGGSSAFSGAGGGGASARASSSRGSSSFGGSRSGGGGGSRGGGGGRGGGGRRR